MSAHERRYNTYLLSFWRGQILFRNICLMFFCLIQVFLVSRLSGAKFKFTSHKHMSCCVTTCDGADDWGGVRRNRMWKAVSAAESERCACITRAHPCDCIRFCNFSVRNLAVPTDTWCRHLLCLHRVTHLFSWNRCSPHSVWHLLWPDGLVNHFKPILPLLIALWFLLKKEEEVN